MPPIHPKAQPSHSPAPVLTSPQGPTTFMEFLCERLMGPPTKRCGNGDSYWPCFKCGAKCFHTKPYHPNHRDGFKCFRCDAWGDEFDILRHFFPRSTYPQRKERLEALRLEYEELRSREGTTTAAPPPSVATGPANVTNPIPGIRGRTRPKPRIHSTDAEIDFAIKQLSDEEVDLLYRTCEIGQKLAVDLTSLAYQVFHRVNNAAIRAENAKKLEQVFAARAKNVSLNGDGHAKPR